MPVRRRTVPGSLDLTKPVLGLMGMIAKQAGAHATADVFGKTIIIVH
jgi:hypothetical protein